jgi:hypothetical protein
MDAEDLELFERSLRFALVEHEGEELDAALDDLGWSDALGIEPRMAIKALFELQGAENASSMALDAVLASGGGLGGERPAVLALARLGQSEAPGRLEGGRLFVRGLAGAGLERHDLITVTASDGSGGWLALGVEASALEARRIEGLDPALGLFELVGDVGVEASATVLGTVDWDAAVTSARLALAHELVGASRAMLELARTHALERIQFGVPISSFQAVRHRLADTLIAVESASALLDAAWEDGTALTAAMAKAYSGRSARTAAAHAQQVLAGMGFTAEHPFHHYLRRVMVLDQLFGSNATLTRQLGAELLAGGSLPSLFPL